MGCLGRCQLNWVRLATSLCFISLVCVLPNTGLMLLVHPGYLTALTGCKIRQEPDLSGTSPTELGTASPPLHHSLAAGKDASQHRTNADFKLVQLPAMREVN